MAKKHSEKAGVFCPSLAALPNSRKGFLRETIETWQPLSPIPLTEKDAADILAQTLALAEILKKIEEEAKNEI